MGSSHHLACSNFAMVNNTSLAVCTMNEVGCEFGVAPCWAIAAAAFVAYVACEFVYLYFC